MSGVKYFGSYYAVLTKNQKDKYDAIEKKFDDALAIQKTGRIELNDLYDKKYKIYKR